MQHVDDRSEVLEQSGIALSEFIEHFGLFFKYSDEGITVVTVIELGGKWVVAEIFPSLFGVLRQGNTENCLEVGGRGGCIRSR